MNPEIVEASLLGIRSIGIDQNPFVSFMASAKLAGLTLSSMLFPQILAATDQVFEYFPLLADRRRQLAGYLSGGERQMLALATALLCRPAVLLVDELSLGLAPAVIERLMILVARLRDELGLAVLLVEQNAGAALAVADYGYVMEHGRIVYDGPRDRLLAHADVREFYLGVGHRAGRKSYTDVKQYRRRRRWF